MKNKDKIYNYFKERETNHIKNKIKDDEIFNKKLEKEYKRTIKEIDDRINWWIGKYADSQNIKIEDAKKLIQNADITDLQAKIKEYLIKGNISEKAIEEFRLYNLAMKVSRDELLMKYIDLELASLGESENKLLSKHLEIEIIDELKRQSGVLGRSIYNQEESAKIIKEILDSDFQSTDFSERIWTNQKELRNEIQNGLNRSLLRGQNPKTWKKDLMKHIDKRSQSALYQAKRLAVTETSIMQVRTGMRAIQDAEYKKVMVITEPNACDTCKVHDGAIVNLKDAEMGSHSIKKGIPIWHPFCKCVISAYEDEIE